MNRILRIIFPVVAVVMGIVAIVLGARKLATKNRFDASTTAVITGIEREWTGTDENGFDEYNYTVYIDYEADGKKYENAEYPVYNSSMKKGDTLEILYVSSDPTQISEKNITGNAVIFIAAGAVLVLVGAVTEIKALTGR